MVKRSFRVIFIQVIGLILNFISMYVLVGGMDPQTYSLVGVYNTLTSLIIVFTQLGLESIINRNALYWQNNGKTEILYEYISEAVFIRVFLFAICVPAIAVYLLYLNNIKYGNQYLTLFIFFIVSLLSKSMIDCIRLILKAIGKYELAQIVDVFNQTVVKIVGIIVFIKWGSIAYMYVFTGTPVIVAILLLFYIRKMINFRKISIKRIWCKAKDSKYLLFRIYTDYFRQSADSLLVSLFFSTEIMGSYSVFKTIEQMCKSLIEGFFDVLTQEMVKLKGKVEELTRYEKKTILIRNICMLIGCIGLFLFIIVKGRLISLMRLNHYQYIDIMIIAVILLELAYVCGKIEINVISLLATQKQVFALGIIVFACTFISYAMVIFLNNIYCILIQRVIISVINSLCAIIFYRKNKSDMFKNSAKII